MRGLINGADTDAFYLDFVRAFDKVDHQLLIKTLRRYGFNEHLVLWIEFCLTNRSHHVVVNIYCCSSKRCSPRVCIRALVIYLVNK